MTAEEIKNILSSTSAVSLQTAEDLKPYTQLRFLKKGVFLEKSGAPIEYEFIVKQEIVRKYLSNSEGREFTTGFFCQTKPSRQSSRKCRFYLLRVFRSGQLFSRGVVFFV